MKKLQITSIYLLFFVVVFFLIFLQPLFAVRFFKSPAAYMFFRILSGAASVAGIIGVALYSYIFKKAIVTKQTHKPILWLELPLAIASITIITVFLIPLTISP